MSKHSCNDNLYELLKAMIYTNRLWYIVRLFRFKELIMSYKVLFAPVKWPASIILECDLQKSRTLQWITGDCVKELPESRDHLTTPRIFCRKCEDDPLRSLSILTLTGQYSGLFKDYSKSQYYEDICFK